MARIVGVTLSPHKKVEFALPAIFGVGLARARNILALTKIDPNIRVKDLVDSQVDALRREIESKYRVEGELRREILSHMKRLKEIGSYRGYRHTRELPVHGQRTKTNCRTVKHNRRVTMGSGRKETGQKT